MERVNPFRTFYEYQNKSTSSKQRQEMGGFPLYLDVELTNCCNMQCIFCAQRVMSRERRHLSEEHYQKVLDQAAAHGAPLRFVRWGEPLLHPRFKEFMRLAKERGLLLHVTTNGTRLDEDMARFMVDLGLDSLKVSFQGVDAATYYEMRRSRAFEDIVANVARLRELRGDAVAPFLHVASTVTSETPEQVESFKARMAPLADSVEVGKTNLSCYNVLEMRLSDDELQTFVNLRSRETVQKIYCHCSEVFTKLSVNSDGSVSACCADYDNVFTVGSLDEESLGDIWRGKQMNEIRDILERKQHRKLSLCSTCFLPYVERCSVVKKK